MKIVLRVLAEVPHDDLLLHADLRGGEGEAVVGGVEGAEHLVDEAQRLAVDVGDGRRLGLEHGVAEGADLLGHACQATDGMPHYFDPSPGATSAEATVRGGAARDVAFTMRTDRGVFSHGRLDAGTAVLLRSAPAPPATGVGLDLGCGAGPIALTMALRVAGPRRVGGRRQRAGPGAVRGERRRPTGVAT